VADNDAKKLKQLLRYHKTSQGANIHEELYLILACCIKVLAS